MYMLRTYEAILIGDRIEFRGGGPQELGPLVVHVTVIGSEGSVGGNGNDKPGSVMASALERVAQGESLSSVTDPVAWQREIRKDRDLPDRKVAPPSTPDAP